MSQIDERRASLLAIDAATFRALGHRLVDQVAQCLEDIPRGPVTRNESPSAVPAALDLDGPLPESGTDAGPLFEHSLFNGHPRFFGYITSSPAPIGILGDLLAAAINPNVGAWTLSPAATEIADGAMDCGGRYVLRACIVNFHTERADVDALPELAARVGRLVDAELRPGRP